MKYNINISNLFKKSQKQWRIRNKAEMVRKLEIRLVEAKIDKNIKEIEKKLEGLNELEKTIEKLDRIIIRQETIKEMEQKWHQT